MSVLGIVLWSSESREQAIVVREDDGRLVCITRTPVTGGCALAVGDVVDFDIRTERSAMVVTRCAVISKTPVNPAEWVLEHGKNKGDRVTITTFRNEIILAANSPEPIRRTVVK